MMATSYPGGLDTFTALPSGNLSTATAEGRRHGARHNDVEDAVEAIEAELGTDPSGAAPTVAARLAALDVTVAGKETSGAAVAAVAAHAGAGDPHSQYATDSDLAAHVAASTAHIPAGAVALGRVGAVRWDETVGRRAFMWDTVNSRWQMVYGDTGWRQITSWDAAGVVTGTALAAGWTPRTGAAGGLYLRRLGQQVFVMIDDIQCASAGTSDPVLVLPSGFRNTTGPAPAQLVICWSSVNAFQSPRGFYFTTQVARAGNTTVAVGDYYPGVLLQGVTDDAWPASLPGVASGSIPAT